MAHVDGIIKMVRIVFIVILLFPFVFYVASKIDFKNYLVQISLQNVGKIPMNDSNELFSDAYRKDNGDLISTNEIKSHLKEIIERDRLIKTDYVFPADNYYGKIIEPKKVVSKVKQLSECLCGWHDLRRTFLTIAETLGVGSYMLKRLANHALTSDVTEGYMVLTSEALREPSERIHQRISELLVAPEG